MPEQQQCPFCQLLQSEDQTFDVHESEDFKAWLDINPRAKGHTMIVPREHLGALEDLDGAGLFDVIQAVAVKARKGLGASGVSIVINDGEVAGQRLDHFYVQVFPRFEGEESEGAPAGAMFQPLEEVGEENLEEWSSAMADVDTGAPSKEGVAKEMLDRKREGGERREEDAGEADEDGGEPGWEDAGAEFK